MRNTKKYSFVLFLCAALASAQNTTSLNQILDSINIKNPVVKMFNSEIKSMNEAAKGAKSWMAPEVGAGFFMTPYNPMYWKSDKAMGMPSMGQFMLSAQQTFPNRQRINAQSAYMNTMSTVEEQKKNYTLNLLVAEAKLNFYNLLITQKKLKVLNDNESVLNFMIQSAELRYKNNMEKIGAYYKTKAALGKLQSMKLMLEAEVSKNRIALNTILNRSKSISFNIDTNYVLKEADLFVLDTGVFINNRSDLKGIEKQLELNRLNLHLTNAQLKPEFGLRYDHMFTFGDQPQLFTLMGMMKIPLAPWSSKMYRSQATSLKFKNEALLNERQMKLNEAMGMANSMKAEYSAALKNLSLYNNQIIPALKNNFKTFLIGYQQNTEELFMLYDAWETLNMTQMAYLDKVKEALLMQTELEKIMEVK
ncbi:MAG: TolC family protein [Bacteroidetes bacterium]|nr:TolC family protein [Bacteroidota bacterium]